MGGNVTVTNSQGIKTKAEKIDLIELGRSKFIKMFNSAFKSINKGFTEMHGDPLWVDESILQSGIAYNGSTSFVMDPNVSDDDILKYKPTVGDLDITIPTHQGSKLWEYLSKGIFEPS